MARSDALPPGDDDEDEEGDDDWVPRGEEDDEDEDDADEGDDGDDDDEGDDGDDDEDEDEDADNAEVEEEDDQSERRPASGPAQHGADNAPRSSRVRERAAPVTPTAPGRTPLRARTPERSARQESSPGAIPPGSDEHIGRRTRAHFSLADKQIAELEALLTTSPTTSPPRSPYTDFLRSLHTMMDEAEAAHAPAGAQLDEEDEEEEDDDYDYLLDRAANGDEDEAEEEFAELVVDEDELVALVEPPRTARGRKRKAAADEATAQGPPADPPAAPAQASVDGGAPADTAVATPVRLHAPPLRRTSPRHVPSGAVCAQPPPSQPPQTAVTALVHTASARAPIEPLAPASALVGSDAGPVPARGWTPEQLRQLQAQLHQHLQVLVHLVLHSRGLLPDKARPQLALTGQPIEAAAVDILQLGRNMLLELRAHAECTLAYKRLRARPCFATPLVAPPGERLLLPRRAGAPPDASGARRGARGPAAAPAHARAPRTATQPWTVFDVPGLEHVQRVVGMIGPIPPPSAGVDAATITDSLRGRPFCHATARRLFSVRAAPARPPRAHVRPPRGALRARSRARVPPPRARAPARAARARCRHASIRRSCSRPPLWTGGSRRESSRRARRSFSRSGCAATARAPSRRSSGTCCRASRCTSSRSACAGRRGQGPTRSTSGRPSAPARALARTSAL